jgi:hypothetical protein
MSTGSLPGVKQPGHGIDLPLPSTAKVKEKSRAVYLLLWAFMACYRLNCTFTYTFTSSWFNVMWRYSLLKFYDIKPTVHLSNLGILSVEIMTSPVI